MRYIILLLLLAKSFTGICQSSTCKVTVKGKVMYTFAYKGGARPSPELLEACCQPRPMFNATLYLKKNYYSPLQYVIKTDDEGNFKKRLRPGLYKVFLKNEIDEARAAELSSGKIDQNNAWITEPYYVIKVVPGETSFFDIAIRERLSPEERLRP